MRKLSRSTTFGLGALLLASASMVSAQYAERPADRLSRYLRELSSDPTSLSALIGAGQAALDVGDGNAALGFFARADERASRNGQVKAGLARAFLMVDNPREALRMFDAARSLGVQEASMAGDRGLAHDLRGDNRKAQQDYALALTRGASDEVTKRYALSLGIAGDREQALKLLDPLLYKRDQGAWRARAFVLAMTGDVPGASTIVHQVMPARMAQTMDPFLARLGALTPAQKAAAVHLGEMPPNARFATSRALAPQPVQPRAVSPTPTPTPTPSARAVIESREPRRRPGAALPVASPPPPRPRIVAAPAPSPTPAPVPNPTPTPAPIQVAQLEAVRSGPPASSDSALPPSLGAGQRGDLEAIIREIRTAASAPSDRATPAARLAQATPRVTPRPTPSPSPKPEPAKQGSAKAKTDADTAKAKLAAAKKKPELPKHPARIWVQVAGGANIGALPREWSSVAAKAAELKGKGPWTAKNRATNRLLAGPFKSEAEAQAAVGRLRKAGVGAFQWASGEGEAVEKLAAK